MEKQDCPNPSWHTVYAKWWCAWTSVDTYQMCRISWKCWFNLIVGLIFFNHTTSFRILSTSALADPSPSLCGRWSRKWAGLASPRRISRWDLLLVLFPLQNSGTGRLFWKVTLGGLSAVPSSPLVWSQRRTLVWSWRFTCQKGLNLPNPESDNRFICKQLFRVSGKSLSQS